MKFDYSLGFNDHVKGDHPSDDEDDLDIAILTRSFLDLKFIDISSTKKKGKLHLRKTSNKKIPDNKSMLERINEVKDKNTQYETIINTIKNSNVCTYEPFLLTF
jgi:hypothetical protein